MVLRPVCPIIRLEGAHASSTPLAPRTPTALLLPLAASPSTSPMCPLHIPPTCALPNAAGLLVAAALVLSDSAAALALSAATLDLTALATAALTAAALAALATAALAFAATAVAIFGHP